MAQISDVKLKVNCFHLQSSASTLDNKVGQDVCAVWLASTQHSSLGSPFDGPYNGALDAMAADLQNLLTAVDNLAAGLSSASDAYNGAEATNTSRYRGPGGHGPV